jgi:hypothetical protein
MNPGTPAPDPNAASPAASPPPNVPGATATPALSPASAPVPPPPPPIRSISRFEANLVRITRFVMRQVPAEQAMPLLTGRLNRPRCLSADAIYLVKDSLAKGLVVYLARVGGWRPDRGVCGDGSVRVGRLWERLTLPERTFRFSAQALEFLIWLTACNPNDQLLWEPDLKQFTPADQWLVFSAFELLRGEEFARSLRQRPETTHNPLCRLAFPDDFATAGPMPPEQWRSWLTPPGVAILEAMQPYLQTRWVDIERRKSQVVDWGVMRNRGVEQQAILDQFLQQCVAANRRDQARFLLRALGEVLQPNVGLEQWLAGLLTMGTNTPARLSERIETQRLALAVIRQILTLNAWTQWARSVAYYDEEYSSAQVWLAIWTECEGGELVERAQRLLRQIEPLRPVLGANPGVNPL